MKHPFLCKALLIVALSLGGKLQAQTVMADTVTAVDYVRPVIFNELADSLRGGRITIFEDERIERLIAYRIAGLNAFETTEIQGYRLQVYSSNAPQQAKSEAFAMEKEMQKAFPEIPTYVVYNPPFWKVRMGNFRSSEEGNLLRQEITKKFPDIQGDVYLVRDMIQIAK